LAPKDAVKEENLPEFSLVVVLMGETRTFFNYTLRKSVLTDMEATLNVEHKDFVDVSKPRFLTSGDASIVMIRNLPLVLLTLENMETRTNNSSYKKQAKELLETLTQPQFVCLLYITRNVLMHVNEMNRGFQDPEITYTQYRLLLTAAVGKILMEKNADLPLQDLKDDWNGIYEHFYGQLSVNDWEFMKEENVAYCDLMIARFFCFSFFFFLIFPVLV
jgi:hypothetical protein